MPTYQYRCTECAEALEVQQSFTDVALTVCPHCEGRLRKVFNAVGVVFKGSGFYRNDSRQTSSSGEPAKSESKEVGSKESGSKEASTSAPKAADSSSGSSSSTSSAPAKKSGSESAA